MPRRLVVLADVLALVVASYIGVVVRLALSIAGAQLAAANGVLFDDVLANVVRAERISDC
jgi:hypothetical protein